MKKEPKSEKPSFFKELGEYIRPYRGQFALSIIVSLLAVFCGLAVYGVVGVLCGEIFEGDEPPVPCPICGAGREEFEEVEGE